jgi:cation:H+ antiporter
MLLDVLLVALGLGGLFVGGEWLVKGAARIATSLGIPALVIGLTVVAFGTSVPELVVSMSAAARGTSDIALGNVIGSNIANVGLILGVAGIIAPLAIHFSLIGREIPVMIAISIIAYLMALDGRFNRLEGVALLVGYIVLTFWIYRAATRKPRNTDAAGREEITEEVEAIEGLPHEVNRLREIARLVVGLAILVTGANLTIEGGVSIAREVGVSDLVIGLTLVAVGTSLPELVTSIMATARGHDDLAAGNVVGSNIANILIILGATSTLNPIGVEDRALRLEFPVMLGFSAALLLFVLNLRLERWEAFILLGAYTTFIALQFA